MILARRAATSWLLLAVTAAYGVACSDENAASCPAGAPSGDTTTDVAPKGGVAMSEYEAKMPDGSVMVLEILSNTGSVWMGDFVMSAESGPYAFQGGSFEGTVEGNAVTATVEAADGAEFQLAGTTNDDGSLDLTRSDLPGTPLHFTLFTQVHATAGGETSFLLAGGGTNGRVTLSTTPASVHSDGAITEYRGTWNGLSAIFWQYASGTANLVLYIDPMCVTSAIFSGYRLSDFTTATVTSGAGQMTMYSSVVKRQIKFKIVATASP